MTAKGVWIICVAAVEPFQAASGFPGLQVVERLLVHVRQEIVHPAARLSPIVAAIGVADPHAVSSRRWETGRWPTRGSARPGRLLEVVLALHPSRRFPCRLHRREQQRDQNADDRDHHKNSINVKPLDL